MPRPRRDLWCLYHCLRPSLAVRHLRHDHTARMHQHEFSGGTAHFDWRLDYLPAVDNYTKDYLVRTEGGLNAPLIDPISAKFVVRDEYDSRPSAGAKRNSLFLTLGLSLVW
ncbi:MAG: DUF481 domain-containing protein [Candidatus Binatia bacterium]